jgi:hypothetical protein
LPIGSPAVAETRRSVSSSITLLCAMTRRMVVHR